MEFSKLKSSGEHAFGESSPKSSIQFYKKFQNFIWSLWNSIPDFNWFHFRSGKPNICFFKSLQNTVTSFNTNPLWTLSWIKPFFPQLLSLSPGNETSCSRYEDCWPAIKENANGVILVANPEEHTGSDLQMWYQEFVEKERIDLKCVMVILNEQGAKKTNHEQISGFEWVRETKW